jgi:hypothetical protein
MNIPNLDYDCYLDSVEAHRNHQEEWLRSGYAPRGFYLKDCCLLKVGDTYHLFHIAGTPGVNCCLPGNEIWFGHATTPSFGPKSMAGRFVQLIKARLAAILMSCGSMGNTTCVTQQ